ncbi:MAG: hypothetical protein LWX56_07035 [Ignavibacteria bacterium]|nr:hypothetical protein [Ignavibacteria bacterium]
MLKKYLLIAFGLATGVVFFQGCDDTLNEKKIDQTIIPDTLVSFAQHISPVLQIKCATSGCHDEKTTTPPILTDHYHIIHSSIPQLVVPYNPVSSQLIWAIEGSGQYLMPPLNSIPLTPNQIKGIRQWVKEGAKNN